MDLGLLPKFTEFETRLGLWWMGNKHVCPQQPGSLLCKIKERGILTNTSCTVQSRAIITREVSSESTGSSTKSANRIFSTRDHVCCVG